MTITTDDKKQLIENYCNYIIDGLDMDSLVQLAYDYIIEGLENWTEEDMKDEILINYDEEMLSDLLPE